MFRLVRFGIVKVVFKILANYHCLLAFSAFVWVWAYNGEFWHKVDTYIAHNLAICHNASEAKSHSEIPATLVATPTTLATTDTQITKNTQYAQRQDTKQALRNLSDTRQNPHSISSDSSSPPPPSKNPHFRAKSSRARG